MCVAFFHLQARMGEVGGNTLGYYGCAFGSHGDTLIAHGYHGAFNMWRKNTDDVKVAVTLSFKSILIYYMMFLVFV